MNKELLKLLEKINQKKAEVKDLVDQGKLEEATSAKEQLQDLQKKFDILKDVLDTEQTAVSAKVQAAIHNNAEPEGMKVVTPAHDAVHEFADAARNGFRVKNTDAGYPNEANGNEGGYTVPQDIMTRINKYKEAKRSLADLVDSEVVSTNTGRRTFQKRSQHTGFSLVAEGAAIQQKTGPQFEVLNYAIKKYGGYMPVTNELLADSDANITNTIVEWLGEEDIATRNSLILAEIADKTGIDLSDLDGIKTAINVTLGQAFAGSVKIVTNDDGFNYLDTLKDENKQYLLKPALDPAAPIRYSLAVGARIIPVEVVPNSILASTEVETEGVVTGYKLPFIIGDLKEGIKIFDRNKLSIMASNVAAAGNFNAYEMDMTLFRGIDRLDVVTKDEDAFVNGYISVSAGE